MKQCWIISEGAAGMENQALGLAEALGIKPICVKIPKPPLHNIVPPQMQFSNHLLKIIKDENPDYLVCAFDSKEKNFRHKIYKD